MEPWLRFFIVDTSVTAVQGLRFGRGFADFKENGEPRFVHKADSVKMYEAQDKAMEDFNKITEKVALYSFLIQYHPITHQANVTPTKIATK